MSKHRQGTECRHVYVYLPGSPGLIPRSGGSLGLGHFVGDRHVVIAHRGCNVHFPSGC